MIDDKKLKKEIMRQAMRLANSNIDRNIATKNDIVMGFYEGAYSGIDDFKKLLWYDASEKPDPDTPCLVYGVFTCEGEEQKEDYAVSYFTTYGWTEDFFPRDHEYTITRWCYIDDLLPRKEDQINEWSNKSRQYNAEKRQSGRS